MKGWEPFFLFAKSFFLYIMKIFSSLSFTSFLLLASFVSFAQEEAVVLLNQDRAGEAKHLKSSSDPANTGLLNLPFYDDFAKASARPDQYIWNDSYVYVNNSYAVNQPSVGLASFDALDGNGQLYKSAGVFASSADVLTSRPINLKTYIKRYLSSTLYGYSDKAEAFYRLADSVYFKIEGEYIPGNELQYWYSSADSVFLKNGNGFHLFTGRIYDQNKALIEGAAEIKAVDFVYSLEDDVALSFYYQAGGVRGLIADNVNIPDEGDSLILECNVPYDTSGVFINEIALKWVEIYNANESPLKLSDYSLQALNYINNDSLIFEHVLNDYTVPAYGHVIVDAVWGKGSDSTAIVLKKNNLTIDSIAMQFYPSDSYTQSRTADGGPGWRAADATKNNPNQHWTMLWNNEGKRPSDFEYVQVPLESSIFLSKGFRFRFRNLVSVSPEDDHARSVDIWNVDEVLLQSKYLKPYIADLAMVSVDRPMLKEFYNVPYKHFLKTDRRKFDELTYNIRSFDSDEREFSVFASIEKNYGDFDKKTLELEHISMIDTGKYEATKSIRNLEVFDFIAEDVDERDEASFSLKLFVDDKNTRANADFMQNDTVSLEFDLQQYYSYDDGSSEAGYGLKGARLSKAAFRFSSLLEDTLRGVYICLNPTADTIAHSINLMVWEYDNGVPGRLIMADYGVRLKHSDKQNGFVYYEFEPDSIIKPYKAPLVLDGKFFIGWQQTKEFMLNIGVDLNTVVKQKLYYSFNTEWNRSSLEHPLMIRPVFGAQHQDYLALPELGRHSFSLDVMPVPANEYVHIRINADLKDKAMLTVFSSTGMQVFNAPYHDILDVSDWNEGLYFVRLQVEDTIVSKRIFVKH